MWESNPPKEAYETPQFARTVTRNIKFITKTSFEVPYGLNVVSGNIALLPIAVELCEHLRLVKNTRQIMRDLLSCLGLQKLLLQAEAWRV